LITCHHWHSQHQFKPDDTIYVENRFTLEVNGQILRYPVSFKDFKFRHARDGDKYWDIMFGVVPGALNKFENTFPMISTQIGSAVKNGDIITMYGYDIGMINEGKMPEIKGCQCTVGALVDNPFDSVDNNQPCFEIFGSSKCGFSGALYVNSLGHAVGINIGGNNAPQSVNYMLPLVGSLKEIVTGVDSKNSRTLHGC